MSPKRPSQAQPREAPPPKRSRAELEQRVRQLEAIHDSLIEDTKAMQDEVDRKGQRIEELQVKLEQVELRLTHSPKPSVCDVLEVVRSAYVHLRHRDTFVNTLSEMRSALLAKWWSMGVRIGSDGLRAWNVIHVEAVWRALEDIWKFARNEDLKECLQWYDELVRGVKAAEDHFGFSPCMRVMSDEVVRLVGLPFEAFWSFEDANMRALQDHPLLGPELMLVWRPKGWGDKLRQCFSNSGWRS